MTEDISGRSADALNFLENVSLTREGGVGGKPNFIGVRKRSAYRAEKKYGWFAVMQYRHDKVIREWMKRTLFSGDT